MEGKEQQRIQHLRNESEKREATRLHRLEGDLKKEQDKMVEYNFFHIFSIFFFDFFTIQ